LTLERPRNSGIARLSIPHDMSVLRITDRRSTQWPRRRRSTIDHSHNKNAFVCLKHVLRFGKKNLCLFRMITTSGCQKQWETYCNAHTHPSRPPSKSSQASNPKPVKAPCQCNRIKSKRIGKMCNEAALLGTILFDKYDDICGVHDPALPPRMAPATLASILRK